MRGNETPERIVTKFCTNVGVHDVITSANFYHCRLWGLSVVGGQSLGFSIDLLGWTNKNTNMDADLHSKQRRTRKRSKADDSD